MQTPASCLLTSRKKEGLETYLDTPDDDVGVERSGGEELGVRAPNELVDPGGVVLPVLDGNLALLPDENLPVLVARGQVAAIWREGESRHAGAVAFKRLLVREVVTGDVIHIDTVVVGAHRHLAAISRERKGQRSPSDGLGRHDAPTTDDVDLEGREKNPHK